MTVEQFNRTKEAVLAFLTTHRAVNNRELQDLSGISRHQALRFFARMVREGQLIRAGSGSATKYTLPDSAGAVLGSGDTGYES